MVRLCEWLVLDSLADLNNTRYTIDDDRLFEVAISESDLDHTNGCKSRSRRNTYIRIWFDSDSCTCQSRRGRIAQVPVENSWHEGTGGDSDIGDLVERITIEKWSHEPSLSTRTRTVVCIVGNYSCIGDCDIPLRRHDQCSRS